MGFVSGAFDLVLIVLGFGALIFVHELGHFLAAKWAGIRTEGFAIGMGPVALAWRKGVGLKGKATRAAVIAKTGREPMELSERELVEHGIGETEYSLRWLPIGGFVKMLGQDDTNPNYVSEDPRSYNRCSIGKRMIVVSAGVIMNVLLALLLFVVAFMVGVRFEAPVVGAVSAALPAGRVLPDNAAQLGIETPGLLSGDEITHVNGDPARTFADIQIASAMGRPGVALQLTVRRDDYDEPLLFTLLPEADRMTGLLSIGIAPGSSTTLMADDGPDSAVISALLEQAGLAEQGVGGGMRLLSAGGQPVRTYEQFQRLAAEHGKRVEQIGTPAIETIWSSVDEEGEFVGAPVTADLALAPDFQVQRYPELAADGKRDFEFGLFGLVPLTRISGVEPGSANADLVREGDVILRAGAIQGPRRQDLIREVKMRTGQVITMTILREGAEHEIEAQVSRQGRIGITLEYAWDTLILAMPLNRTVASGAHAPPEPIDTPAAALQIMPRARLDAVEETPVSDWASLRTALQQQTASALAADQGAVAALTATSPTPGREQEAMTLTLTPEQVQSLHDLGWSPELAAFAFEPVTTRLNAGGNPMTAVAMGFRETHKLIMMTYLTIDRLFRGSVGIEQLRGPVGIIDLGAKILPRGLMYFLFFLGMISVNLAVINFLPLPIVDGGLFLFLVYEKFKGRPPSLAFQNVATIVGMCMIGALLVVTFYNDIMRLVG